MRGAFISFIVVAGCTSHEGVERIRIADPNELGVVALEAEQFESDAGRVVEIRGVTDGEAVVATIRLRTGHVADPLLGSTDLGSELVFSAEGHDERMVTRELDWFRIDRLDNARLQQLVELAPAVALLQRHHIIPTSTAPRSNEVGLYYDLCPVGFLNVSPVAQQCCYDQAPSSPQYGTPHRTVFVNGRQISTRYGNSYYTGCKDYDGVSPCDGAACYYGPNGYSRAILLPIPSGYDARIVGVDDVNQGCASSFYATGTAPPPRFPNNTGNFPTGLGCPGGNAGGCPGCWDY